MVLLDVIEILISGNIFKRHELFEVSFINELNSENPVLFFLGK